MRALPLLLFDLVLVAVATVLAFLLRDNFNFDTENFAALLPYLALTVIVAAGALAALQVNRTLWRFTSLGDYLRIGVAAVIIVTGALAVGFLMNRLEGVARSLPILQGLLITFFLVSARVLARIRHNQTAWPRSPVGRGAKRTTVLVVGINKLSELYLQYTAQQRINCVSVAGLVGDTEHVGLSLMTHKVLGTPEQLAAILRKLEVHGVFVDRIVVTTSPAALSAQAREALRTVEQRTTIATEFLEEKLGLVTASATDAEGAGEVSIFNVNTADLDTPARRCYRRTKRLLEAIAALVLVLAVAPVMVVVAVLVVLDVGFPLMFWQQRPGLGGRPFRVYKFRTMGAAHDGHGRRRSDDERVSPIGAFLRRTRLDELPQLLSILAGDMSFVGPRPLLPVDQPGGFAARLLVRPGLTGWAQIKGGRAIGAADKAALDVWYVCNMSLALDLRILVSTVPMVLFGERVTETAIADAWRDLHAAGVCLAQDCVTAPAPVGPEPV